MVVASACSGTRDDRSASRTGGSAGAEAPRGNRETPPPSGAGDLPTRPAAGQVAEIDSEQARALIDSDRHVLVVDVRTQDEYIGGHLVGAQNIDVTDAGLWQRRTAPLDRDRPTVVYCRSGSRSADAARKLVEMGFTEVYDLGGVQDFDPEVLPLDR